MPSPALKPNMPNRVLPLQWALQNRDISETKKLCAAYCLSETKGISTMSSFLHRDIPNHCYISI